MNEAEAVEAFGALAHATRLRVFKALIAAGSDGMAAGRLSSMLDVSPSNLSAHLSALTSARLIAMRPAGRSRIYSVDLQHSSDLVRFIVEDCCQNRPEVCGLIVDAVGPAGFTPENNFGLAG